MGLIRLLPLALLLASPVAAQAPPSVHVLATGGTISNTSGPDRRSGDELVESLPGIERVATVTTEQFSNVASGAITLEQLRSLALRIDELFREQPDLAGIVVTHGTDTMEETAYFLDLTIEDCRPVVVTGAMRRATDIGPDGPANLFNAIRLAAEPDARRVGAVILMNDEILPAREATKAHTSRVEAFVAPGRGPVGVTDSDAVAFLEEPASRRCGRTPFPIRSLPELPRVDVVYSYLGADGALIRAAAEAGARGIVVAGIGRGASTPGQGEALREAAENGVFVVRSNRTGAGRVPVGSGGAGGGRMLGADDLTPQKARLLLMLTLARTQEPEQVREIFRSH